MDNILIIDNYSSNIKILVMMLRQMGYCVRNAANVQSALQSMEKCMPQMILTGTDLSDPDSYKTCEIIKAEKKYEKIPVIFICTFDEFNRDKIFAAGGADYIAIPFNYNEIYTRINAHMERSCDALMKENKELKDTVLQQKQQLEDITADIKEFNIMLEEEITERTKTEEALKESERQFRHAVEASAVPVILYTEDGEIVKISRTWSEITGYTIKDISTISELAEIADIFKKDIKENSTSKLFRMKKSQHDGECYIRTKNGDTRIWDFYTAYIGKLQDGRRLLNRIAIDITERKHMEELQTKIEEERIKLAEIREYDMVRTEFFSNISHELRTPINVIFSALQMQEIRLKECSKKNTCNNAFKYTRIMKQNCYRLLRLINNLIDITKIDSGFFDINETNYNIVSLIEDITLSVADYIEKKGLSLIFDTDIEEKIIACDPEKIERIILNLLSNAVKFTPCGGSIRVNIEDGSENICIRVKDNGRGIPAEKLDTIFERFVQVDKTFTRDHEGSGIGLSLVKSLVELHGGTISVKSREGEGAEFIIMLPCKLVSEENSHAAAKDSIDKSYIEKINIEFSDIYS